MTSTSRTLTGDLWGGLASMLVALPSSIAFGVLVFTAIGPEHAGLGAMAGALGAGALGIVAPIVSRNGGFITAPCAPAAAVMSGLAAQLAVERGLPASRVIALMALAALLSAGLQVAYGLIRLGRLIKFIPYQVVSGYLSGVAVIIAMGQLPKLLGLPEGTHLPEGLLHPELWQWEGIVVGVTTIVVTAGAPKVTKAIPGPILGLAAGIGAYFALGNTVRPDLLVLQGNALVIGPIEAGGDLLDVLRGRATSLTRVQPADIGMVIATSATLSILLSIDTLKTGVVLDAMTRRRHDSNRELIAQGVSNVVSVFAGGMPGAGTMGPTLVNVTSGGRSPLSGVIEGALALLAFLALGSLIAWVPIGALAGILLVIAFKMFDWGIFRLLQWPSTRLDFVVIVTVVAVAETIGLIQASVAGVGLAILLFIRDQTRSSVVVRVRDLTEVASKTRRTEEVRDELEAHGEQGLLVELRDNLFFGTTDQLFSELADDLAKRRYILFDLRRVQSLDYTAGHLFHQMHEQLQERDGSLLFSGMPTGGAMRQDIERYLGSLGLVGQDDHAIPIYETRNEALEWMEDQILEAAGHEPRKSARALAFEELDLFREFDDEALEALRAIAEEVQLEEGEQLFERGDPGDAVYLIRKGAIDILLPLPGDKVHHVATFARHDYFGELAFLDSQTRSAGARAARQTELFAISRAPFNDLARQHPVVAAKVFARLALVVSHRLRTANAEVRTLEER